MGEENEFLKEIQMDEIAKGIVETLKETHPDNAHFYVLEQLLLTENANHLTNEHKVWRRVLNHINHETD